MSCIEPVKKVLRVFRVSEHAVRGFKDHPRLARVCNRNSSTFLPGLCESEDIFRDVDDVHPPYAVV